jgi:hypothetical protein
MMEDEFAPDPEDIAEMLDYLLEVGLMEIVGETDDGEPLYKFSDELLSMPEFMDVHEAITNDILFNLWNKGFIEMNPMNEEGDWNVRLCDKSEDFTAAKNELEADEFLLFIQLYQELKLGEDVVE